MVENNGFTLQSAYGNLSVTGDIDDNSTAGTTLIDAGYSTTLVNVLNSTSTYSVSGNVNIASSSGKAVNIGAGSGAITLPSASLSLANLNMKTYSANSGITLNGNVTTSGLINIQNGWK